VGIGSADLERFVSIITIDVLHSPDESEAQILEATVRGIARVEVEPKSLGLVDLMLSLKSIGETSVCLPYKSDIIGWNLQFEIPHIVHLPNNIRKIALKQSLKSRRRWKIATLEHEIFAKLTYARRIPGKFCGNKAIGEDNDRADVYQPCIFRDRKRLLDALTFYLRKIIPSRATEFKPERILTGMRHDAEERIVRCVGLISALSLPRKAVDRRQGRWQKWKNLLGVRNTEKMNAPRDGKIAIVCHSSPRLTSPRKVSSNDYSASQRG
jgi:hypothetical protein